MLYIARAKPVPRIPVRGTGGRDQHLPAHAAEAWGTSRWVRPREMGLTSWTAGWTGGKKRDEPQRQEPLGPEELGGGSRERALGRGSLFRASFTSPGCQRQGPGDV